MSLQEIRNSIDRIDDKIIEMLHERMALAVKTLDFKDGRAFDQARENDVLNRVEQIGREAKSNTLSPEFLKTIFKLVMEESRRLQERERP